MFKVILFLASLYILFCGLYFFFQKSMIYFPDQTDFENCENLRGQGVAVNEGDARYYLFETSDPNPRGIVVHFHGNGGRACDRYPYLEQLKSLGFHLILAEYPGYAQEAPPPSQKELLSSALLTVTNAKKKYPNLPLVLFGESLGAAVATWVGTQTEVQALILQTPFESLGAVGKHHYPWLPVKTLLRHPYPAEKWAKRISAKVFVFHGKEDEIIPYAMGRKQFENFQNPKNVFWTVPDASHNDILLRATSELWNRLESFLNDG